ncbi:12448_t:CDS:2 [Acaulospora morrowiae]|uniref:12448_t:CDS:1 n=1 Tax=Acaulospora morrowiae TaxID=94023 RepID=A0A9N9ARY4_9GLOM|nr:12448_t:CDS:2 [Acaulospora morrowiae]
MRVTPLFPGSVERTYIIVVDQGPHLNMSCSKMESRGDEWKMRMRQLRGVSRNYKVNDWRNTVKKGIPNKLRVISLVLDSRTYGAFQQ